MQENTRVRFAPSPTGPLHIGGIRTALYNYLFAKKQKGTFVLRIEDTDQTRYVDSAEDYINRSLNWCGLVPDEGPTYGGAYGPYRQSERKEVYSKHLLELVEKGKAYYAFDTVEDLEEMRQREAGKGNRGPRYDASTRMSMKNTFTLGKDRAEKMVADGIPYTVRMLIPEGRIIEISDEIRGVVRFDSSELDDKVIMKNDGLPTYHLANVVDDHLMNISHVIRGEEWLSSTAHHVLLYEAFGWEDQMPSFAHLPLILKPTGKGKLSKRDGQKFGFPVFPLAWDDLAEPISGFDSFGFTPEAVVNFLLLLGWNPGTEQEIFTWQEMMDAFSLQQVGKSGARFNFEKALWFNSQYIMQQSDEKVAQGVKPFMQKVGLEASDEQLLQVVGLLKERITTYHDFPKAAHYFFAEVQEYNLKILRKKWRGEGKSHYVEVVYKLADVGDSDYSAAYLKNLVSHYIKDHDLGFGDILPLLRVALTGDTKGPDLFEMMEVLGKSLVDNRLMRSSLIFDEMIR